MPPVRPLVSTSSMIGLANQLQASMNAHVSGGSAHDPGGSVVWSELVPWKPDIGLSLVRGSDCHRLTMALGVGRRSPTIRTVCSIGGGELSFGDSAAGDGISNLLRSGVLTAPEALCLCCYPKGSEPPSPEVLRDRWWQRILDRATADSVMTE